MPIKRVGSGDSIETVVVICDWCGTRIADGREAVCEWRVNGDAPLDGQLFYAHASCSLAKRRESGADWRLTSFEGLLSAIEGSLGFK